MACRYLDIEKLCCEVSNINCTSITAVQCSVVMSGEDTVGEDSGYRIPGSRHPARGHAAHRHRPASTRGNLLPLISLEPGSRVCVEFLNCDFNTVTPDIEGHWLVSVVKNVWGPNHTLVCMQWLKQCVHVHPLLVLIFAYQTPCRWRSCWHLSNVETTFINIKDPYYVDRW